MNFECVVLALVAVVIEAYAAKSSALQGEITTHYRLVDLHLHVNCMTMGEFSSVLDLRNCVGLSCYVGDLFEGLGLTLRDQNHQIALAGLLLSIDFVSVQMLQQAVACCGVISYFMLRINSVIWLSFFYAKTEHKCQLCRAYGLLTKGFQIRPLSLWRFGDYIRVL